MERDIVRGSLILVIIVILFVMAVFDIREKKISNRWIQVLWVLGILGMMAFPEIGIMERIFGSCYISFLMLLPNLFGKRAFGGGDVKLISVCGWLAGAKNIFGYLRTVFLLQGSILNSYVERKMKGKEEIPFAPFICTGVLLVILQHIWG